MTYSVSIKQSAAKALALKANPIAGGVLKGEFSGLRRVGNHRVVYEVQDRKFVVLAVRIGHRTARFTEGLEAWTGWEVFQQPVMTEYIRTG